LIEATTQRGLFRLPTVGRFLVAPGEPTVVGPAPSTTEEDIECVLRGPVGALRSLLEGKFALRGAAVGVHGKGVVIAGSANGTSTLAAALALRGHHIIADGTVVVSGAPPSVSALPEARLPPLVTLWPDSVHALGLNAAEGRVVRPSLPSRGFSVGRAWGDPLAVTAVVVLGVDSRLQRLGHRVAARQVTAVQEKLFVLFTAEWHAPLAQDLRMQKEQFQWATGLARAVPVQLLTRSAGPAQSTLPELVERVEEIAGRWGE
jgi:hypothetical protein